MSSGFEVIQLLAVHLSTKPHLDLDILHTPKIVTMTVSGSDTPPKMEDKSQVEDTERQGVYAPASVRSMSDQITEDKGRFSNTIHVYRTAWKTCLMNTDRT